MSNSISMVGRLGGDPELKQVGQTDLLEFSLCNATGFGDKKVSSWYRCKIWGLRAAKLQPYLSKGSQVFICGELTSREFEKKDGSKGFSLEVNVNSIDFIGPKNEAGGESSAPSAPAVSSDSSDPSEDMPF